MWIPPQDGGGSLFFLPVPAYLARLSSGAIGSSLGELWGCSTPKTYPEIEGVYYANMGAREVTRPEYGLEMGCVTEITSPWVNFYRQYCHWRGLYKLFHALQHSEACRGPASLSSAGEAFRTGPLRRRKIPRDIFTSPCPLWLQFW